MSSQDPNNDPLIEGLVDSQAQGFAPEVEPEEPPPDPDPTPEIPPEEEETGGEEPEPPEDPDPTPEEEPEEEEGCHLVTERNCLVPDLQLERGCEAECVTLAHVTPVATACPIIEGDAGDPISVQLEASGGDGDYTFTLDESDFEDLVLSEDGLLTGALPLVDGTYRYTFTVTDGLGQTASATCTVVILEDVVEPPEVPETACGRLEGSIQLRWSHNSRIGPFFSQNHGEIFFIGRDPGNAKRLMIVKTTDFGETWAVADDTFTAKTNNLASFDCHAVQEDHLLYSSLRDFVFVSMQEATTGRVSYGKVNLATSSWEFTDRELEASITTGTFMSTGITVTSTGDIGVLYQTDSEAPAGTMRNRCGYKYSSDDGLTWSSELQVGTWGIDRKDLPGRPIADSAGRVHVFTCNQSLAVGWGEYWVQTIRADHTLSTVTRWRLGSSLHQIQSECAVGDYCTFELAGVTQIVYVCRMTFEAHYTIFAASDNVIAPYQPPDVRDGDIGTTFNGLGGSGFEANYPQVSVREIDGRLHFSAMRYSNTVPTWIYHKHLDSPYAPAGMTPTGEADQSGPRFTFSASGIPGQEMAAIVKKYEDELYHVSLRDTGTAGLGLMFNWIKLDLLPTDSGHTIDDWAAECE